MKGEITSRESSLNRASNSLPPGHESDTLTTEPTGRGHNSGVGLPDNSVLTTLGERLKEKEKIRPVKTMIDNLLSMGRLYRYTRLGRFRNYT